MIASEIANIRQGERTDLEPCRNSGKVAQSEAAKQMSVSRDSVQQATKLRKEASPEVIQQVKDGKKTLHAALSERKQKPTGKPPLPPRRKTLAEEPEEEIEYLKIPLPIDHNTMTPVFGLRFQNESDGVKDRLLRELALFIDLIQNIYCD